MRLEYTPYIVVRTHGSRVKSCCYLIRMMCVVINNRYSVKYTLLLKRRSVPVKFLSPSRISSIDIPSLTQAAIAESELYTLCTPGTESWIVPEGVLLIRRVYEQRPYSSCLMSAALYIDFAGSEPKVITSQSVSL